MTQAPAHRIEVGYIDEDMRARVRLRELNDLGFAGIDDVSLTDVYTVARELGPEELVIAGELLSNPVLQRFSINSPCAPDDFDWALEIGFLPGVTDNVAHTARETLEDRFKIRFAEDEMVATSQVMYLSGDLDREGVDAVGNTFHNRLIQRMHVKSREQFDRDGGMDTVVPRVKMDHESGVDSVNLDLPEDELKRLGKEGIPDEDGTRRGPMALSLENLRIIKDYFEKEGRQPTDVELESLAQTWSEHCKHTIFRARLDDDVVSGLFKQYIRAATDRIRRDRGDDDFCVSVFTDNAGGIIFDDQWVVSDKVETHNSPSALDPFGGAITGIVGVNRDAMGYGMGAKPVINRYGFCFADPNDVRPLYRDSSRTEQALPPKRILDGVISGVRVGGNCSGIPTPQGFMIFDERYKGKPLVFVGTVGLIPRTVNGKPSQDKEARSGDLVVMLGGRVGQDGIHGATFSSEALDSGSPVSAVQIGDPITQKKLSDCLIKEARDRDLYNSITDNGAGGLSCSVAEMARECGGCRVELDRVPLKYPGLDPWKIWVSESQERMTLAVPPEKADELLDLLVSRGVEATIIGTFTDSGRCVVTYHGETIMDLDMDFLHEGLAQLVLTTTYTRPQNEEPKFPCPDLEPTILTMINRLNVSSNAFISTQYDHEVQAGSAIKPLQGVGRVNGSATVTRPVLNSPKGVVTSQALYPSYGDVDMQSMAQCAIDTAIRNAVSVGGNPDYLAILDNFCWCSSDEPERLGQLKETVKAAHDAAVAYRTPFISGKDSMFNDFKGFDEDGNPVKISVPPTLLISSFGVIDDVTRCVSLDAKSEDDHVYLLGATREELGGSEYYAHVGEATEGKPLRGNRAPQVDFEENLKLYRAFFGAVNKELVASAVSLERGGLAVAVAKTCLGGMMGMDLDLGAVPRDFEGRDDHLLFSESAGRLLVTVDPQLSDAFESAMEGIPFSRIGVVGGGRLQIIGVEGERVAHIPLDELSDAYRSTFRGY